MAARSHLLVRRIEEETFSVVPSASVREGQATVGNPASGNLCEVKVVRKIYEGDVPSVSDNREVLNKIIDQLVNRNTGKASTRELLGTTEHLDELYCEASDNPSPQRRSRDSNHLDDSSFSRKQKRESETSPLQKTAKMVAAAKKRVKEIVSKTPYSGRSDDEQLHLISEIEQLQKELTELKKKIESKQQDCPPMDNENIVKSKIDSLQSTTKGDAPENVINIRDSDDELTTTESDDYDAGISASSLSSQEISKDIRSPENQDEIKLKSMLTREMKHLEALDDVKPMSRQVELVDGYGVYISLRQLDEANYRSANSPTRLLRNLLVVFFEPSVLAASTCRGNKTHPALNPDILGACFRYVQMKHPQVSRTVLVDCVNDKCASYRRKKHL